MPANLVLLAGQMSFREHMRTVAARLSVIVCLIAGSAWPARAQPASPQPAADGQPTTTSDGANQPAVDPNRLPIDISKIQRALQRPPAIKLDTARSVFRIEIFGRRPTVEDILGRDFLRGPAPAGAMTHQEFLNMVTPKDVQGYAAFDNKQAFTVAATSLALQWALQKAIQKFHDAKEARAQEAARREVEEALAELRRARRAAGLPDK